MEVTNFYRITSYNVCYTKLLRVSPEAAAGGVIGLVKEGDIISINIPENKLEVKISDEEIAKRKAEFKPLTKELDGYLKRYAQLVTSGAKGAVFAD